MTASAQGAVGSIGLGIMGGAFARNLIAAGWRVTGHDVAPEACRSLAEIGATIAPDAAAVAAAVSTVITSLPKPQALHDVVAAIVAARLPPKVIVEASTFALEDKVAAADRMTADGHILLDCPMSGTGAQAAVKDLVVLASGDTPTIAALQPMFLDFARVCYDLGAFGNGSRMKFVANLLVAIHNVASAEAMVLAMKSGLDPRQVVDVIRAGAGTSRMFEMRAPMMAADCYEPPTMRLGTWQKDMDVISAFAGGLGVPTPTFDATMPIYAAARAMGLGDLDTGAVCAVLEHMAGVHRSNQDDGH